MSGGRDDATEAMVRIAVPLLESRPKEAIRMNVALSSRAAPVDLNGPGHYVHWGVIQVSVANLVVVGIMVLLFVLALLLPFPRGRGRK